MVRLSPVLRRLLPPGNIEIFPLRLQRFLYQHRMLPLRPGVHPLSDVPTDGLGCGGMTGSLQDHRLKENNSEIGP